MRWKTGWRWIIGVALALLLAGCSAIRLSYNQGPTLAYWWLDGYADFTSEQTPRVKAALADWFAWHRATQLADYQQQLALAQQEVLADTTAEQVCARIEAWRGRADRAFEQAVPAVADIARSITPAQLEHLAKRYAKNLSETERDYLQPAADDRRAANLKRALERAETLYGRLGEPQRQVLAEGLAASPFDPQQWLAERQARQQDILRALRQWQGGRADVATVQAGLRRLSGELAASPRPAYRAYAQRLETANCALIAQVHNATNPAQRRKAAEHLKGWQEDLRVLAAALP
jgi:hypothetical protein